MTTLQQWQKEVFAVFEKIRAHKRPYDIMVDGVELMVLPNVFSPQYFTDSIWFAREVAALAQGKTLLEIGTGTGLLAVFAALRGARGGGDGH